MAESTGAIATAAGANLVIAIAKFAGAALTGSSAMLAEGVHSVVDTLNQALLFVGIKRSARPADAKHPFGYGREIYFYAFVVSLLIFAAGGLYSIYEGLEKILHPEATEEAVVFGLHVPGILVNIAILGFSILVEGYSFIVAVRSLPTNRSSRLSAVRRSKDPGLFVVLIEDFAAVTGLALALVGVVLAHVLEAPVLDGAASVGIGVVLLSMASFLMVETHGLLIGEAADPDVVETIETLLRGEPAVSHINEILTQHFGPSDILVNISFAPREGVSGSEVEALVTRLDEGLKARVHAVRRVFIETQSKSASARLMDPRRASKVARGAA